MAPENKINAFGALGPFSRPAGTSVNRPAPSADYERLRAIANEASRGMEQAGVDNSAYHRGISTTSLDVAAATPGTKRVAPSLAVQTDAVTGTPGSKRTPLPFSAPQPDGTTTAAGTKRAAPSSDSDAETPAAKRTHNEPREWKIDGSGLYNGFIRVTFNSALSDIEIRFPYGTVKMQKYKIMKIYRSDGEKTYSGKGDKYGLILKTGPTTEQQDRGLKDDVTQECSFYHKLNPEYASQCIDWRRKLGGYLAEVLGRSSNDLFILGEFPEGYVMWEHVRGVWVLPGEPNKPIDPSKLILNGNGVVEENIAAPAVPVLDPEFLVVDSPDSADGDDRKIKAEFKSEDKDDDDAGPDNTPGRTPGLTPVADSAYNSASATPAPGVTFSGEDRTASATPGPANNADAIRNKDIYKIGTGQGAVDKLPRDQQPVFKKTRDDLYLYGYKDNKRYASPAEFFPHLLWLATARVRPDGKTEFPCTCHHCDPELEKERKANRTDRIDLAYAKWKEATEKLKVVR